MELSFVRCALWAPHCVPAPLAGRAPPSGAPRWSRPPQLPVPRFVINRLVLPGQHQSVDHEELIMNLPCASTCGVAGRPAGRHPDHEPRACERQRDRRAQRHPSSRHRDRERGRTTPVEPAHEHPPPGRLSRPGRGRSSIGRLIPGARPLANGSGAGLQSPAARSAGTSRRVGGNGVREPFAAPLHGTSTASSNILHRSRPHCRRKSDRGSRSSLGGGI